MKDEKANKMFLTHLVCFLIFHFWKCVDKKKKKRKKTKIEEKEKAKNKGLRVEGK